MKRRALRRQEASVLLRILLDLLAVNVALLLAYQYRFYHDRIPIPGGDIPDFNAYLAAIPVLDLVVLATFVGGRMYRARRGQPLADELFSVVSSLSLSVLVLLAAASLYRHFSYSRLVILYTLALAVVLVATDRVVVRAITNHLRRRGRGCERVLVVGTGTAAETLVQRMQMFPENGYLVVGVVDNPPAPEVLAGVPVLGERNQLARIAHVHHVDEIVFAIPGADSQELLHLMRLCDDESIEFKFVPDLLELITTKVEADEIQGIPLMGLRRINLEGANAVLKRSFDAFLALVLVILASPFLLLVGLLVKLTSRGPVLIHQERLGVNGTPFTIYKFRSMRQDAEDQTGPVFAHQRDPRVTALGRVMRRLSIDELPQLWNVVRGDMSLVGPRPERPHFVQRFSAEVPRYVERHRVRPGLTGWAQVNDLRGNTPIDQRTLYDLYYIENWSLVFDIKIILTTIFRIFVHRHAY